MAKPVLCSRLPYRRCACVRAVDEKEIDTAKMQVQGQLAAQYIQDVMQVPATPLPIAVLRALCPRRANNRRRK